MFGCKIYIKDIKEDSVAGADGRLQPGDVLLEMNDKSLEGLSLKKVKKLLKSSKKELELIVERESDKTKLIPKVMNNDLVEKKCNISPSPNVYPKVMKKICETSHLLDSTPTSTAVNYLSPVEQCYKTQYHTNIYRDVRGSNKIQLM